MACGDMMGTVLINHKTEQHFTFTPIRCACGWPIFRVTADGVQCKHHSCDYISLFPWSVIREWQAMAQAGSVIAVQAGR